MGPEHRRFFVEAGWSKADVRTYPWDRLQAPSGPDERPVKLGSPAGLLVVAAGGPGMAETWILFPHLAWAITEPVLPAAGRLTHRDEDVGWHSSDSIPPPGRRPTRSDGRSPAAPTGSTAQWSGSWSTGSAGPRRSSARSTRSSRPKCPSSPRVPVVKGSVSVPPDPGDWSRLTSEASVAITGFGG